MDEKIKNMVHKCYHEKNINCAGTVLHILSYFFDIDICEQVKNSSLGLHGAGGYRAQCGLVEGALMFIGIYFSEKKTSTELIIKYCYNFAQSFEKEFGSLLCYHLRPNGFNIDDDPHMCEDLTSRAVKHSYMYIKNIISEGRR